jgi:hypothetical protein
MMMDEPTDLKPTRSQWLMLLAIIIVATILRFILIGGVQPHFDELWHLELSTGRGSAHYTLPMNVLIRDVPDVTSLTGTPPWYKIPASLDTVTHPPLYSILLRFWREMFGESVVVGRSFSAVLSILCVIVLFDATRQLHGSTIALWAALIFALAPTQIQTAQQIRNYTMLLLFALCAADMLLRIERHGISIRRIFLLALALLATLFTHYFAAPAVAAMGIYSLWRFRGRTRWLTLGTIVLACAIFFLTWYPTIRRQSQAFMDATGSNALHEDDAAPSTQALKRLSVEPIRLLFEPTPQFNTLLALAAAIYLIPWLLLRHRPELLFWTLWLFCVVGFAFALDVARTTRHLDQIRHTILAGAAVCALFPAMLAGQRPLLRNGLPALIALACLGPIGLAYSHFAENYEHLGSFLSDAKKTDEPIVFYSDPSTDWWSGVVFLGAAHYSGAFPRAIVRLDQPASPQVLEQLHHWPGFWLIWFAPTVDWQQILPGSQITSTQIEPYVASVAHVKWIDQATQP